eukprot:gnl/TRDRNA2_/TRDRNA2_177203_c1_seq3.p1 gnl/TRDRNA2_/TRDRNA2_177203_c1~~gnl/TRDRNA2_/TRDRNA2_177203_c1_seq3.p1  ORF type:complete len:341 (+),score=24.16 gnl/TRDRNA2_/TRDRNA2_177203_c1_seq3:51-1025(+)
MERQQPHQMTDVAAGPEQLEQIDSQQRLTAAEEVMQSGRTEGATAARLNRSFADAFGELGAGFSELVEFVHTIPDITPTDDPILLPVSAIRLTHHTVNEAFACGDDHNESQESMFKLFLNLLWGRVLPDELDPLHVFLHRAPDGKIGLYSPDNRRLLALRMFQGVQQGKLLRVPCKVFRDDHQRPAPADRERFAQWFRECYGAPGSRGVYGGFGFSILPRAHDITHRYYPTLPTKGRGKGRGKGRSKGYGNERPSSSTLLSEASIDLSSVMSDLSLNGRTVPSTEASTVTAAPDSTEASSPVTSPPDTTEVSSTVTAGSHATLV